MSVSCRLISLTVGALLLGACGASTGTTAATETAAAITTVGTAISALFGGIGGTASLARTPGKSLDSTQEICNNLGRGPAQVLMIGRGSAGQYGDPLHNPITVVATDFCQDEDGLAQSGTAADGGPRFATFVLATDVSGTCGSGTVALTKGSGIMRNVDGPLTMLYGTFEMNGTVVKCTMQIDALTGALDTAASTCIDLTGTTVSVGNSSTCSLSTAVARMTVPTTIEGHYGLSTDEGQTVAYDCHNYRNMTTDADGLTTISTDCNSFDNFGFNLAGLSIGYIVTGDETDWSFHRMGSLGDIENRIKLMRLAGYPVLASVDMLYVADYDPTDPSGVQDGADFPAALLASTAFQEELVTTLTEIAATLEAQNVEVFAPLAETDRVLGSASAAATFMQTALSQITPIYTGQLMWIGMAFESNDPATYNLTGFDYAATNISPMPSHTTAQLFSAHVASTLSNMSTVAATYGIPFLISNAGVWGEAIDNAYAWGTDTNAREALQIMQTASQDADAGGIIFWEGAAGEVTFDAVLYPLTADYIKSQFQ